MLRIVEEKATNQATTLRPILRLDGRLAGQWVGILRASCEQAMQERDGLILDMSGVSFADHEGVRLLRQLERQQVALLHCSPFLREQMKPSSGTGNGMPPNEQPAGAEERRA